MKLIKNMQSSIAFAPATSANFCVGYDLLGFALDKVGDTVKLVKRSDSKLIIKSITGVKGSEKLPLDSEKNVATAAIKKFLVDKNIKIGFDIYIQKGITLGSGMGGSAASAVAALVAMNAFFEEPYSKDELVDYSIYAESLVSGSYHGDNAVPCLYGGLVLLQSSKPCRMLELPTLNCSIVIVCPELSIETKKARELLDKPYELEKVVEHSAYLAATISALYTNDLDLLSSSLKDVLIEPRRAQLITGFYEVQRSAYSAGAIACGISGSGPAMFAIVKADDDSSMVAKSMQQEFKNFGLKSDSWVSCMSKRGAFVISKN